MRQLSSRPPILMVSACALALLVLLPLGAARAQVPGDAARTQISDALAKGDLATADRIMSDASAQAAKAAAAGITTYERLVSCGFYPQETRLACSLDILQATGFGGGVGQFGSFEFVYFCVDWDDSGAYGVNEAVGLGIVHLHDESDAKQPRWQYAVYRDIDPPGALNQARFLRTNAANPAATMSKGSTRRARAILSWNAVPTSCNYSPAWGNAVDFRVRFDPIH